MTSYQEKLLDPRWQRKRLEIFERDEWKCRCCGDGALTLCVHHRYYEPDCEPWESSAEALLTLCCECHEMIKSVREAIQQDVEFMKMIGFLLEAEKKYGRKTVYNGVVGIGIEDPIIRHRVWDHVRQVTMHWKNAKEKLEYEI